MKYLTPHLTYEFDRGIHRYQFQDGNRASVDAILTHYEMLRKQHPTDQPLCLMVDIQAADAPSLSYLITQVRASYQSIPPVPLTFIAYIITDNHITRLGRSMLDLLRLNVKRKFFLKDELEQAYQWLTNR